MTSDIYNTPFTTTTTPTTTITTTTTSSSTTSSPLTSLPTTPSATDLMDIITCSQNKVEPMDLDDESSYTHKNETFTNDTLISSLDIALPLPDLVLLEHKDNTVNMQCPPLSSSSSTTSTTTRSNSTPLPQQQQARENSQQGERDSAQVQAYGQEVETDVAMGKAVPVPSEVVLHIFRFLSAPQDIRTSILVCKQWCLCGIEMLWSRPAMVNMSVVERLCKTLSIGTVEQVIHMDQDQDQQEQEDESQKQEGKDEDSNQSTPTSTTSSEAMTYTTTVFPYQDYVRRLNFSFLGQDLTDTCLVRFSTCTRLERLLLPGCINTTEHGLKEILKAGRGLYSLDLSGIPAVTDSVLEHVATFCPRLHTLYLSGCTALTDESLVKLASSCASLKRIKLNRCALLTDASILALTQNCRHLMEIDVTSCNLLTNNAIQSVFQSLPQIRDLNLTLVNLVTDLAFTDSIPAPTTILAPATATGMPAMSLSFMTTTLVPFMPKRFEQLRVLNLTSCVLITDDTLARILPAAPRLRNLTLTKCDRITDVSAHAIKLLGKHLHYLHLGHCSKLTDKAITTLAQHCTRIRYLDLACCSKLTDAAVFAMAQLPKLRRIGLVKCSNITDHGIYAMLVSQVVPQSLERVHLSYCVHLSDTAVSTLVQQCTKLTHLSVTGVPSFMSPKYQKFCRLAPSEFTAHQREVFCVFSGKGVRELRQFMKENPATSSTLSNMQQCYRLMGSTVASMVAGGQHSSTILANLGFALQDSETANDNNAEVGLGDGEQHTTAMEAVGNPITGTANSSSSDLTITMDLEPNTTEQMQQPLAMQSEQENGQGQQGAYGFMLGDDQLLQLQQQQHHHQPRARIAGAVTSIHPSLQHLQGLTTGGVGSSSLSAAGSSSSGSGHASPANDGGDEDEPAEVDLEGDDEDVFGEEEDDEEARDDEMDDDVEIETYSRGSGSAGANRRSSRRHHTSGRPSSGSTSRSTRRKI
ncbi:SCF ubiquitin ligase complex subunit [Gryganskiella cystojenkinii]|nr:SCF ubiquitin ligase complex subunit [Gryganskiella cystojenkinii]